MRYSPLAIMRLKQMETSLYHQHKPIKGMKGAKHGPPVTSHNFSSLLMASEKVTQLILDLQMRDLFVQDDDDVHQSGFSGKKRKGIEM